MGGAVWRSKIIWRMRRSILANAPFHLIECTCLKFALPGLFLVSFLMKIRLSVPKYALLLFFWVLFYWNAPRALRRASKELSLVGLFACWLVRLFACSFVFFWMKKLETNLRKSIRNPLKSLQNPSKIDKNLKKCIWGGILGSSGAKSAPGALHPE